MRQLISCLSTYHNLITSPLLLLDNGVFIVAADAQHEGPELGLAKRARHDDVLFVGAQAVEGEVGRGGYRVVRGEGGSVIACVYVRVFD